jgi:inosine/xanthosine triphosphatase
MTTKTVAVGSTNPVKIAGIKEAFEAIWPEISWDVKGVSVESGVSSQPMSDEETIEGATNRAKVAIKALGADFGVGPEGGLAKINGRWFNGGWIYIIDSAGIDSYAPSAKLEVAPKIMQLIRDGRELGQAVDIAFGLANSKQGRGHHGEMTNGVLLRQEEFRIATIAALGKFLHPELY